MLPCPSRKQPTGSSSVDPVNFEGRVYQRGATRCARPSDNPPLHAQIRSWLSFWIARRGCRPRERMKRMADPRPEMRTGSKISLLVDADAASPSQIRAAIKCLGCHGNPVETSVFCAPGRSENAKMRSLLSDPSITFRAVARKSAQLDEANDAAIVSALGEMAKKPESKCIAVMTIDKDFVTVIKELRAAFPRIDFVAVIPARHWPVRDAYASAGIRVVELPAEERCSKVRAILDVDGNGWVEMAEAYDTYKDRAQAEDRTQSLDSIFEEKGFLTRFNGTGASPIQLSAKLGFVNRLGPMVIFPVPLATRLLHAALQQDTCGWSEDIEKLAFVLPCTSPGRNSAGAINKYGSRLAKSIFRGGGPFMLEDSDDIVVRALRMLGYLDDALNDCLPEAMTCFLNNSVTNFKLRKLGIEVHHGDTTKEVAAKLRVPFTSNHSDGRWRRGGYSKGGLLRLLRLSHPELKPSSSENEILAAMKEFAFVHGLPQMRSFNGQAWCIKQYVNRKDPSKRSGRIEIKR